LSGEWCTDRFVLLNS